MEGCCIVVFVILIIAVIAAFGSAILYMGLVIYYVILGFIQDIQRKSWGKTLHNKPLSELEKMSEDLAKEKESVLAGFLGMSKNQQQAANSKANDLEGKIEIVRDLIRNKR